MIILIIIITIMIIIIIIVITRPPWSLFGYSCAEFVFGFRFGKS